MRIVFLLIISAFVISSCSTPKYTASFSNYQRVGENTNQTKSSTSIPESKHNSEQQVLASTSNGPLEISSETNNTSSPNIQINKKEQKEAVKKLRSDIKTYVKEQKKQVREGSYQDFEWDNDLKLAMIFGAAGLVGVLLGGISVVFSIVGGIALIIAVVFFVQWVLRQ